MIQFVVYHQDNPVQCQLAEVQKKNSNLNVITSFHYPRIVNNANLGTGYLNTRGMYDSYRRNAKVGAGRGHYQLPYVIRLYKRQERQNMKMKKIWWRIWQVHLLPKIQVRGSCEISCVRSPISYNLIEMIILPGSSAFSLGLWATFNRNAQR